MLSEFQSGLYQYVRLERLEQRRERSLGIEALCAIASPIVQIICLDCHQLYRRTHTRLHLLARLYVEEYYYTQSGTCSVEKLHSNRADDELASSSLTRKRIVQVLLK